MEMEKTHEPPERKTFTTLGSGKHIYARLHAGYAYLHVHDIYAMYRVGGSVLLVLLKLHMGDDIHITPTDEGELSVTVRMNACMPAEK